MIGIGVAAGLGACLADAIAAQGERGAGTIDPGGAAGAGPG